MSDLINHARSLVVAAADKLSPVTFLENAVAELDRADVEKLAVAYLLAQVKGRNRSNVLSIERGATTKTQPLKYGTAAWETWATLPENLEAAKSERNYRADLAKISVDTQRKYIEGLNSILNKFKDELRVEWTRELLDQKFALGDGTDVTWGHATREQHEIRLAMHKRNAIAGLEGAARHQQAIETLESTGCLTLGEAVKVAA